MECEMLPLYLSFRQGLDGQELLALRSSVFHLIQGNADGLSNPTIGSGASEKVVFVHVSRKLDRYFLFGGSICAARGPSKAFLTVMKDYERQIEAFESRKSPYFNGALMGEEMLQHTRKERPELYKALKDPPLEFWLGINARRYREKAGLTQAEAARKAGLRPATLQQIEAVLLADLTLVEVEALASALNVRPRQLFVEHPHLKKEVIV